MRNRGKHESIRKHKEKYCLMEMEASKVTLGEKKISFGGGGGVG
jgi:hypothetical protein